MMPIDYHKKNEKGFVLVILAALLMILGIFMLKSFPLNVDIMAKELDKTNKQIERIKRATLIYYEKNGKLPCPANPKLQVNNVTVGESVANCAADLVVNGTVVEGAVPIKALGLPISYMTDEWGSRYTYVMDTSYTAFKEGGDNISVLDKAGTDALSDVGGGVIPKYMGLIISHGPDKVGAYNAGLTAAATRPAAGNLACAGAGVYLNEYENCDGDANFYSGVWSSETNRQTDDIISYLTPCPGAVNGCTLWLDASDVDGDNNAATPVDNSDLTNWFDKSGQGYNALQTVVANKPKYKTSQLNGKSVIRFDGNNNEMGNSIMYLPDKTSVFAVVKETSASSHHRIFQGSATLDACSFFGTESGNFATFYGNCSSAWNDIIANVPNTSILNNYNIVGVSNNGTLATPYVNGVAQTAKVGTTVPAIGYKLGGGYPTQNMNGDLAEIVVYNAGLSANNSLRVQCSMARKWGVFPKAGLTLWLDAMDINGDNDTTSGEPSIGDNVSTWVDKSGAGNNFTTPTPPTTSPTLVNHASLAGKRVISFTPSQILKNSMTFPASWTVISVSHLTGTGSSMQRQLTSVSNNWLLGSWGWSSKHTISAYFDYDVYLTSNPTYDNNWRIYIGKANPSTGYFYADGHLYASSPFNGAPVGLTFNGGIFPSETSDLEAAEVIAYNRALTDEERTIAECYLSEKWGVNLIP